MDRKTVKQSEDRISSLREGQMWLAVSVGDYVLTLVRDEGSVDITVNNRNIVLYPFEEALEFVDGIVELFGIAKAAAEKESEGVWRILLGDGRFAEVRGSLVLEKLKT
jgi:hypothetical protein